MRKVELRDIRNFVCQGTSLEVRPGELLVLLGPNGAGKTTLLNVIAGLVPYHGRVLFDEAPVDAVPARERNVGYVFQDLVLFPHLNVVGNIAYGLHDRISKSKVTVRVQELLELLGISHLSARYPVKLSGGEKQRVALARALAPRPTILLLDEPFGHLDGRTAAFMRSELKSLQRDLGTTTVFVTHDLAEAEQIADRIAIIQAGMVEQIGAPDSVLLSPCNQKVTEYLGSPNVLECAAVRDLGHGLAEVDCSGLPIVVPHNGKEIKRVVVLPRDVLISTERPAASVNVFEGTIGDTSRLDGALLAQVRVGRHVIAATLPNAPFESSRLQQGRGVFVELRLTKLRVGS